MNKSSLRIVFMGTPEFSVPVLDTLHNSHHEVVAVISSVDKLGGRGKKQLLESAVKKYAVSKNIPVLQPKNLKAESFNQALKAYNADIQVVVAFRMLPVSVWDMPPLGTINLHASLLPEFRGAAPINWAVITGAKVSGLTSFKLKHEIDTGNVIDQIKIRIGENDSAGILHDQMMEISGPFMLKTIDSIASGNAKYLEQDNSKVSKAPKIFRETCEIDFQKPLEKVHNQIRGLSPYPAGWAKLNTGETLKFISARKTEENTRKPAGTIVTDNKHFMKIACDDGLIEIIEIQLAGKKRMKVSELLNGYNFKEEATIVRSTDSE